MVEGRIKLDGKGGFSTTKMWTWQTGDTRYSVGKYEFSDGKQRPAIFITHKDGQPTVLHPTDTSRIKRETTYDIRL